MESFLESLELPPIAEVPIPKSGIEVGMSGAPYRLPLKKKFLVKKVCKPYRIDVERDGLEIHHWQAGSEAQNRWNFFNRGSNSTRKV